MADGEIPDRVVASALEFAVGIAAAGAKLRPAMPFPTELKPFLKFKKLPAKALADVRRAVEGDAVFLQRLGSVAVPELVDPAGMLWLVRPHGWREQLAELAAEPAPTDPAGELRRSERRREAAEQAAQRTLAELAALQADLDRRAREVVHHAEALERITRDHDALRATLQIETKERRRATERLAAANERNEQLAADLAAALVRADDADRLRDDVLAARAAEAGQSGSARGSADQSAADAVLEGAANLAGDLAARSRTARELAAGLDALADRLAGLEPVIRARPAPPPRPPGRARASRSSTRRPIGLPGGVYGSSHAAAEHLVRQAAVVALVDGYNVAKLGWPQLDLEHQRERCIAACEDVARRYGTLITVVFDGSTVLGASAPCRRLVRVTFSPEGVIADDVLRDEVASLPADVPVVVVTNDQAVLTDVRALGANTLTSEQWLALGHR